MRVLPGQDLLLLLSHESEDTRNVQLVDAQSRLLAWNEVLTNESHAGMGDGILLIRNRGQIERRFHVHVRAPEKQGAAESVWHDIPFKTLSSDHASAAVGFSSAHDLLPIEVHVHARWFGSSAADPDSGPHTGM